MRTAALAALFFLTAVGNSSGQTVVTGDAWVLGSIGAGTTAPGARFEAKASSMTQTVFQLSGVDGTPLLMVDRKGRVGLSTTPAANLDVNGYADSSDAGLELRSGGTGRYQILFATSTNPTYYRHAIQSAHVNSVSSNSISFLIWDPSLSATDIATTTVVSLVTHSTGAAVHIRPAGYANTDLVVSDGSNNGAGTVHRALEVSPSSRQFKEDISYLGKGEEEQAFDEVAALRLASFRYKKKGRLQRGIIYEDAPDSVRKPGGFISMDARLSNSELALKEIIRRLDALEAEAGR